MNTLKVGDSYHCDPDPFMMETEGHGGEHAGHTATVTEVRPGAQARGGDDPQQAEPNTVYVKCSCGRTWWFLDDEREW